VKEIGAESGRNVWNVIDEERDLQFTGRHALDDPVFADVAFSTALPWARLTGRPSP